MELLPKNRLEAFADGVFAIAITLLVLEIPVPGGDAQLWEALKEEWPSYLAYVLSFGFIGAIWISHSGITKLIKQADSITYRLNLLLLMFVATLPFTTTLMATQIMGDGARLATVIYGVNLLVASMLLSTLMRYMAHDPDLALDEIADEELLLMEKQRRSSIVLGAAGILVAIVVPLVAVIIYFTETLVILFHPLVGVLRKRRSG